MRAAKVDRNHGEIVEALRGAGAVVASTAAKLAERKPWECVECKTQKPATVHQMRKTYCSKECMASGYRKRMIGESNPNHRDAGNRVCAYCGVGYQSYSKTSKFCSHACSCKAHTKPKQPRQIVLRLVKQKPTKKARAKKLEKNCIQCGALYLSSPSQKRLFCSYRCHLDSGGAFRAGIAASKATLMYGPKKDANHNEIFDELRKHCSVVDASAVGGGMPDGIAWVNESIQLFDVKNPKTGYGRAGLNKVQQKWVDQWAGPPVYLLYTVEDAKNFGTGKLDAVKRVHAAKARSA